MSVIGPQVSRLSKEKRKGKFIFVLTKIQTTPYPPPCVYSFHAFCTGSRILRFSTVRCIVQRYRLWEIFQLVTQFSQIQQNFENFHKTHILSTSVHTNTFFLAIPRRKCYLFNFREKFICIIQYIRMWNDQGARYP